MIIELPIGKSNYQISCKHSEREKLSYLAEKLNKRLNRLSKETAETDEKTLLAMLALVVEEELEQSENKDDIDESPNLNDQDVYDTVSETMENIADYIEKMTIKIQNY
jgi:cell division protein ZapA (FtsZ GTPase activity inhibitor)